jgi:ABC-type sugar transport system permease subunit
MNFFYSFTEWKGFGAFTIVGVNNYIKLLHDEKFWISLKNISILILYIPLGIFLPLFLSAILRDGIPGWNFYKVIMYIPNILGFVVLGSLYKLIFREYGPFNQILLIIFPNMTPIQWLSDVDLTIHVVGFLLVVLSTLGFRMIYLLSAMSAIPGDFYDSAKIDGASWWQTFWFITIPTMRRGLEFLLVLAFIQVFARTFGFIYTMTFGGPGFSTYTLEFGIYQMGFAKFKMGYASTWSSVLALICGLIAYIQIKVLKRED